MISELIQRCDTYLPLRSQHVFDSKCFELPPSGPKTVQKRRWMNHENLSYLLEKLWDDEWNKSVRYLLLSTKIVHCDHRPTQFKSGQDLSYKKRHKAKMKMIFLLHQGQRCLYPKPCWQHFRKGAFTLRGLQNEMIAASCKGLLLPLCHQSVPCFPSLSSNTHSHREPLDSMQAVG